MNKMGESPRPSADVLVGKLRRIDSRPAFFDEVLPDIATLAESGARAALDALAEPFADALDALEAEASAEEVRPDGGDLRFELDANGRVSRLSAAAAVDLGLEPQRDIRPHLTVRGRQELAAVQSSQRETGLVILSKPDQDRPALASLRRGSRGSVLVSAALCRCPVVVEDVLGDSIGLAPAEIQIARLLFEGLSPKEIARLRDRSIETIRKQVRTIFAKTATRSVLDLVHLIYGIDALTTRSDREGGAQPTSRQISMSSGRTMDVALSGPRDGRGFLFLHGCLGGRALVPTARSALRSRTVIAAGRPGHGRTAPDPSAGPRELVPDLVELLDMLGHGEVDLVAYDTGAAYALALANAVPERIGRIILVSTLAAMPKLSDLAALPRQQRLFPLLARTSAELCTAMAGWGGRALMRGGPDGFGRTVFAGADADLAACRMPMVQQAFWHGHAWHTRLGPAGFVADARLAATDWLAESVPLADGIADRLVYVHGTRDLSAPVAMIEAMRARTGGALVLVEGAGHSLLHSHPDAWLEHLGHV
ncbi:MAG: alpha/beta fold hydrolase [Pseudomonadota bacterium]